MRFFFSLQRLFENAKFLNSQKVIETTRVPADHECAHTLTYNVRAQRKNKTISRLCRKSTQLTHHSAPAVPAVEVASNLQDLNDIEFVVIC